MIALAFLDSGNNASYQFYGDSPLIYLCRNLPKFQKNDIVFFGDFIVFDEAAPAVYSEILEAARECLIYFDPNVRGTCSSSMARQYFAKSDVVKFSSDDFQQLFQNMEIL